MVEELTTPVQIGPRLRAKLWAEAIELAAEYERTTDHHRRQKLQAQFDAMLELLTAAISDK
jgi:hypothetical protein